MKTIVLSSIQTAGIALLNNGKVLILKSRKGYWDLPKGRLDEGEKPKQAAVRETLEETGIPSSKIKLLGFSQKFAVRDHKIKFFIGTTNETSIKLHQNPETGVLEHTKYKWVTLEEARKKLPGRLKQVIDWVIYLKA